MVINFKDAHLVHGNKRKEKDGGSAPLGTQERGMVNTTPDGHPIRRPAFVKVSGDHFVDDTPQKKKEAAEPLKKVEDIIKVSEYLIQEGRYRDNLIFVLGINLGLRCGDLSHLKVGHLLAEDGAAYREDFTIQEEKTSKYRKLYLNESIYDAADLYFANAGVVDLNDYLFKCESNRGKNLNQPLSVRSIERMLKEVINDKCGIEIHASTHCLRKTFAYHVIQSAPDRERAIEFLQKILGHSSQSITLRYAGITDDEVMATYKGLNLGARTPLGWISSTSA